MHPKEAATQRIEDQPIEDRHGEDRHGEDRQTGTPDVATWQVGSWQIGTWRLDTARRELQGPDGTVHLRPQAFRALLLLVERAPALVSKDEFLAEVWQAQAVSDSAIAQVIRELRARLGDDPTSPRFIATRHRQGYQLVASVRPLPDPSTTSPDDSAQSESEPASVPGPQPVEPAKRHSAGRWFAGVLTLALFLSAWAVLPRGAPAPTLDSAGWPTHPEAQAQIETGLEAARRLDSATALRALQAARGIEATPRLSAQVARLLVQRGQTAAAREILDTAGPTPVEARDALFASAVVAELEGRNHEAGRLYALLAETHPTDVELALARWETEADPETVSPLAAEDALEGKIPTVRRLLILAQQAGRDGSPEEQLERADELLGLATLEASPLVAWARYEEGKALRSLGKIEVAVEALSAAAERFQEQGELRAASRALGLMVDTAAIQRQIETLRPLLSAYAEAVAVAGDPWEEARLAFMSGRLAAIEGHHVQAAELFEIAVRRCEPLEAWNLGATALGNRADALQKLGELDQASTALQRAVRWAEASRNPNLVGQASINLGNYLSRRDELAAARDHYEKALEQFRQARYLRGEAAALINLARLARWQGMADRSVELSLAAGELFESMGLVRGQGVALFQAAEAELDLGDLSAAGRLAREALEDFRHARADSFEALTLATLSEVALRTGDLARAGALLDPRDTPEDTSIEARTRLVRWRALRARELGHPDQGRRLLEAELSTLEDRDDSAHGLHLQLDLARLDLEDGRPVAAEETARQLLSRGKRRADLRLRRAASLLLAESFLAQQRLQAAEEQVVATQRLVDGAADFRERLRVSLVQARIDALLDPQALGSKLVTSELEPGRVGSNVTERLRWIRDTAFDAGHRTLALEAQVELARHGALDALGIEDLRTELEDRSLGRLALLLGR